MAKLIALLLLSCCLHAEIIETDIQKVQQPAREVFGLTARPLPVNGTILKQLAHIGIQFTFTAPCPPAAETKSPTPWKEGALFLTDFNRKGKIFRKWLEPSLIRPSKVVIE